MLEKKNIIFFLLMSVLARFPKYGWKVKLNHQFPEERNQYLKPSLGNIYNKLTTLNLISMF